MLYTLTVNPLAAEKPVRPLKKGRLWWEGVINSEIGCSEK